MEEEHNTHTDALDMIVVISQTQMIMNISRLLINAATILTAMMRIMATISMLVRMVLAMRLFMLRW